MTHRHHKARARSPASPAPSSWSAPARWAAPCWKAGSRSGSIRRSVVAIEPQPTTRTRRARQRAACGSTRRRDARRSRGDRARGQAADRARGGAVARAVMSAPTRWCSRSWPAARSRFLEQALPQRAALVRAMPNTPAAIGRGITVAVPNSACRSAQRALAHALLSATGAVEWVDDEALMDAVTAVSGSGPAYVFLLAETLARAGAAAATGIGITPAQIERLFQDFSQGDAYHHPQLRRDGSGAGNQPAALSVDGGYSGAEP